MTKYTVLLNSIEKIKNFVNTITRYPYDFDLVSGRYTIDAKSIMGIFSLVDPTRWTSVPIRTGMKSFRRI